MGRYENFKIKIIVIWRQSIDVFYLQLKKSENLQFYFGQVHAVITYCSSTKHVTSVTSVFINRSHYHKNIYNFP